MTDPEDKSGRPEEEGAAPDMAAAAERGGNPSTLEKAIARVSRKRGAETPDDPEKEAAGEPAQGSAEDKKDGEPDAEDEAAGRQRRTLGPRVIAALSVLLLLAVAYIAWPAWGPALPGWMQASLSPIMGAGRSSDGPARLDVLAKRIEPLEKDIARLKSEFSAQPVVDPKRLLELDDLVRKNGERLAALKTEIETLSQGATGDARAGEIATLSQRLASLEERMTALAAQPAPTADAEAAGVAEAVSALDALRTQSGQRISALESENVALRDLVATLDKRLGTIEQKPTPDPGATRSNALLLAVGQLREAGRGTAPFTGALDAVAALAESDDALAKPLALLKPPAKSGVPDLIALRVHFDRIAGRIAHESFVPKGDGWIDRTLGRLSRIFTVRRTGTAAASSDDENGRVARAELRLAAGDLGAAIGILEGLQEPALSLARPWLEEARARLAVDAAIAALFSEALARTRAAANRKGTPGG